MCTFVCKMEVVRGKASWGVSKLIETPYETLTLYSWYMTLRDNITNSMIDGKHIFLNKQGLVDIEQTYCRCP